ncbi:MAG: LysR family transcriptional regulator [Proteobacteria bacterium]|nr:LysR family transcriptional regulator [Pseudomonadota bacterium]
MNKLFALDVFTKVAEHGSFTSAAQRLNMSVSAVTKTVARLEEELGAHLLNRTTRKMSFTDYGLDFYERCVRILADLKDAEENLRFGNSKPIGRIKAVVPHSFGRVTLVPALPQFLTRYPHMRIELDFSDTLTDLIGGGYDIAVRTGQVPDSSLVTRVLNRNAMLTVASPRYLAAHGTPLVPQDLKNHNCLIGRFGPEWGFLEKDGSRVNVRVSGNVVINSGDALREAAAAGIGIIQGTWWLVRKDLQAGSVQTVLDDYAVSGTPISVLYPGTRIVSAKVKAFIEFLIEITKDDTGGANR